MVLQVGYNLLDDALSGECDALGGVVVVEQSAAIAEITVERVDKNFERALHALPHRSLRLLPGLDSPAALCLRLEPAPGQLRQHREIGAKGVPAGGDPLRKHDRRVEALDIALHDRSKYTRRQQFGVTASVSPR